MITGTGALQVLLHSGWRVDQPRQFHSSARVDLMTSLLVPLLDHDSILWSRHTVENLQGIATIQIERGALIHGIPREVCKVSEEDIPIGDTPLFLHQPLPLYPQNLHAFGQPRGNLHLPPQLFLIVVNRPLLVVDASQCTINTTLIHLAKGLLQEPMGPGQDIQSSPVYT